MAAFDKELSVALEVAERAAELIRREYDSFTPIPDAPADISTPVDRAAQELILRLLHERFPADALCAEESISGFEAVPRHGRRVWVVDPIDGTRGFARKNDQFSVMIGLLVEGRPVVGVVAEPARQRVTYAQLGRGCYTATAAAAPVACRVSSRPEGEIVLAQSWSKPGRPSPVVDRLRPARVIETYSGGVKLALVARGEADVYANTYETFYDWDICAGHLLVTEAGGTVTDLSGQPISYQAPDFAQRRGLLASNGPFHTEFIARLGYR